MNRLPGGWRTILKEQTGIESMTAADWTRGGKVEAVEKEERRREI